MISCILLVALMARDLHCLTFTGSAISVQCVAGDALARVAAHCVHAPGEANIVDARRRAGCTFVTATLNARFIIDIAFQNVHLYT